ncbi:hemerythrin domain-containing protein [Nonlabens sp. Asnod3-A02]|uniref:hemerythrin domain-containing protein n=1 Tax=Nonlabens sp. Asnod3-A02 TaxID=3160579 RepID=UPI00386E8ADB
MNIFEALRKDHEIQRDLIDQLVKTSGDSDKRKELFDQLKKELALHEDAEERHFYVPLLEVDMTQEKARHSIAEHHEMDELVKKIEETDRSSSAWLVYMKELAHQVEHHLDEEEQEVFQLAGKALNETEKKSLATDYQEYMKENR